MLSLKFKHVVLYSVIFFLLSSPYTYTLVDRLVGSVARALVPQYAYNFKVAEGGCPTTYGLVVHSVVFGAIAYYLHSS